MSARIWTARLGLRDPRVLDITRKSAPPEGIAFAPSWAILRPALDLRRVSAALVAGAAEARANGADDRVDVGDDIAVRVWSATWSLYSAAYRAEMRESYRTQRHAWDALLSRAEVVLCCYCVDPEECHRTLLAREILPRLGATYEGEVRP